MNMKTQGSQAKIAACVGSVGCGFSFCCSHIEMPRRIGRMPMKISARRLVGSGASHGRRPKRLKIDEGVRRRQVLQPAEEGRVAQFQRDENHLVEREEDRDLQQDGKATRSGVHLFPLVEFHHLLLHLLAVVAHALLDLLHLRLKLAHPRHRGIGLVGQREKRRP